MECIEVSERAIQPYIGKTVCAVLHDGSRYAGTVLGCADGKLIIGSAPPEAAVTGASKRKKKQGSKAQLAAFYPYSAYPGAFLLDLAWIWLLFAIPFLIW